MSYLTCEICISGDDRGGHYMTIHVLLNYCILSLFPLL